MESFFHNLLIVVQQVTIMFILIAIGFALAKTRRLAKPTVSQLTTILLWVITPCTIVKSFLSLEATPERNRILLWTALAFTVSEVIGAVLARLVVHKGAPEQRCVLQFAVIFSNCGFMSLPLAQALFGDEGACVAAVCMVVFNISAWTYGVYLHKKPGEKYKLLRILVNPGVIGFALALPLYLFRIKLPEILFQPVGMLGALNTPMAMIIIGFYLAQTPFRPVKGDGKLLLISCCRLLAVPLLSFALLKGCRFPAYYIPIIMVPISAPSATNGTLFATLFGNDAAIASRQLSFSTVLSILTLPVLIALAQL